MSSSRLNVATSLELRFLIDRHLTARRAGHHDLAIVYAHAAEGLLTATMPAHANAIASVASRKGDGRSIGGALAQQLPAISAAAVNVIWLLRGARRPAIDALSEAFRNDPTFNDMIRMLCASVLPATPNMIDIKVEPTEIAAPYRR